jgi:hypothetical protein
MHKRHSTRLGFLLALLAAATACGPVRLVSEYDEAFDRAVMELHRSVGRFLFLLERTAGTPEGRHARHAEFYDAARADLRAIRARAESVPRNALTAAQLALVEDNLAGLERMHRAGLKAEEIEPLRRAFDAQIGAILKLELAKKRGG